MYPCPGGCGRSNDTGSWCGNCSWMARPWRQNEELRELAQSWPFTWRPPATAWYRP